MVTCFLLCLPEECLSFFDFFPLFSLSLWFPPLPLPPPPFFSFLLLCFFSLLGSLLLFSPLLFDLFFSDLPKSSTPDSGEVVEFSASVVASLDLCFFPDDDLDPLLLGVAVVVMASFKSVGLSNS